MKLINIFLLTLFLIIGLPRFSDAQIEPYSKILWASENHGIQAYASCQSFDFTTTIIGESLDNKAIIIKLDDYGNPIWSKAFIQLGIGHIPRLVNIINTSDSCQIILGHLYNENNDNQDAFLAKIDNHGEILWTKTNSLGGLVNLTQTSDSGFILTGEHKFSSSVYNQLSIVKITKNGNLEWSRKIRFGTALSKGLSVIQKDNDNYIVAGYYKNENETKTTALLVELSNTGEVNWSYGYNNDITYVNYEFEDIIVKNNQYILLMNTGISSVLVKTDTLGTLISAKEFDDSQYYDMGHGIKRKLHANNQNELVFIHRNSFGGFIKTDLNAENAMNGHLVLPTLDIHFKQQNELLAIGNGPLNGVKNLKTSPFSTVGLIQMNNEGIANDCFDGLFECSVEDFEIQQFQLEFIIEGGGIATNKNIDIQSIEISQQEGCIELLSGNTEKAENIITFYPNPSQGYINFEIEEGTYGVISIVNYLGQIVHQQTINQQHIKIDLNRFINGVYLYHIESDKALISSGRFILNN